MDPRDVSDGKFWFGVAVGATMALAWMEAKTLKKSVPPKCDYKPNTAMFPTANTESSSVSLTATHLPAITPVEKKKPAGGDEVPFA